MAGYLQKLAFETAESLVILFRRNLRRLVYATVGQREGRDDMCVAVPSRLVRVESDTGIVEIGGAKREISLLLLSEPTVGDYVIVHAGFAIRKIDEEEARETLKVLREAASILENEEGDD
jgi:hydrogenase expression/formation protein HypC